MDRYTQFVLTVIAVCLAILVVQNGADNGSLAHAADTPSSPTCEWTWVQDGAGYDIGKDGAIQIEGGWARLQTGGWRLAAVVSNADVSVRHFFFERCR